MDDITTQREELAAGLWEQLQNPAITPRDYASCANSLARLLKDIEDARRVDPEDAPIDGFLNHLESLANARRDAR